MILRLILIFNLLLIRCFVCEKLVYVVFLFMDNEQQKYTFDILKNFISNKSSEILVHFKNKTQQKQEKVSILPYLILDYFHLS